MTRRFTAGGAAALLILLALSICCAAAPAGMPARCCKGHCAMAPAAPPLAATEPAKVGMPRLTAVAAAILPVVHPEADGLRPETALTTVWRRFDPLATIQLRI